MAEIARQAREASAQLALAPADAKTAALKAAAAAIRSRADEILSANADDLAEAKQAGLTGALLDRLALDPKRLEAVASGPEDIAAQPHAVGRMLKMSGLIDITVPRGGASLIERVQRESRIPVIAHLEGLCHTYIDRAADPEKARSIVLNAKMRRVSICGATETLLVDRAVARIVLPPILADLRAAGCELRGDPQTLPPRGPVAAAELTPYKYRVRGNGQVRP